MSKYMKAKKLKFNCKKCFHGVIGSCTNRPKLGCTYFYDAIKDKFGPGYAA